MKKSLTTATLVGLGACVVMLILSIFGVSFFTGVKADILISVATLTAGGFFALTSVNLLKYNKNIAYISLSLISLSVLLIILGVWIPKTGKLFTNITITFALLSVLFNTISSGVLKLQKRLLAVQLVVYLVLFLFIGFIILSVFGVFSINDMLEVFLVLLVLSIAGIITLSVLANKTVAPAQAKSDEKEFVKISKSEYLELLQKAKAYDELTKQNN